MTCVGRRGISLGLVLLAHLGCAGQDADPPAPTTTAANDDDASRSDTSTSGQCMFSEECATTGLCVAPYDRDRARPESGRCASSCIGENALDQWCLDDQSCCEGLLCHRVDGLCQPPSGPASASGTRGAAGESDQQ